MSKNYFSILQWITQENIVNEKGEGFDFYDRPWLLDILTDWNPNIVVTACAQVGKSMTFIAKASFAIKYLGLHIIHTFPTDDDVREFVASKVNKFLQANHEEFSGMDTDSIERKEMNARFWFFKGTVSKTAPISTTADILIHDEISRSDQHAIQTYKSRTKASKFRGRWMFSNPGTERDELDLQWLKSDQKEWTITCKGCQLEQYLSWPENIDVDNKKYVCKNCKKEITDNDRRDGKWVAQNPGSEISGYHISHLMCCWIPITEIIEDSQGDPAYFNNFVLGKPYSPGDLQVNKSTILDIWTPKNIETGNWYIGVDVGNLKHYTLGSEKGIIKVGRFTNWQKLDDILTFYKPKAGVIDAMPDNTMSKYYVEKYPFMQMSYFQENANNPQTIIWQGEGDKTGIVYSHRDRVIDRMLADMVEAKFLIALNSDKEFLLYVKHFETLRRIKETNSKGIERYVWDSTTGEDHFVFSTLYWWLAIQNGGGVHIPETLPRTPLIDIDNNIDVARFLRENNGW